MGALPSSALVGTRLIDDAIVVVLLLVRNAGGTHLIRRGADLKPEAGAALCGATADLDAYRRPRWRRSRTARHVCNACHAAACRMPTRISWL